MKDTPQAKKIREIKAKLQEKLQAKLDNPFSGILNLIPLPTTY